MNKKQSRRHALKNLVAGTAAISSVGMLSSFSNKEEKKSTALKGNVNHSACRWCYGSIPMEELAIAAKNIGLVGIDLVGLPIGPSSKNTT